MQFLQFQPITCCFDKSLEQVRQTKKPKTCQKLGISTTLRDLQGLIKKEVQFPGVIKKK